MSALKKVEPLAKELLRNRPKIVWVTRLRQAQDDAERK